ncbi:MAG: hypothetical protein AVDCRST_MAG64-3336 [uncultured Phycisphaerae bacterium]|uniref:Uncharacterized protein n=1 Tax=uncultured Phycisphaerae bacterium TaxID=904963 RepID=A0A6J4PXZ4_9BACT|nr:MAG: hypothetical protein AVDCRST_MAG64-3336 [uncultured Phycisphaerae bacterium]
MTGDDRSDSWCGRPGCTCSRDGHRPGACTTTRRSPRDSVVRLSGPDENKPGPV